MSAPAQDGGHHAFTSSSSAVTPAALAPAPTPPKAGVEAAPKPPKAGALLAPKSGVLAAPKAGELPNREGVLCWTNGEALLPPNKDVVPPKAGVLLTEKGLLNAIVRDDAGSCWTVNQAVDPTDTNIDAR